MNTQHLFSHKCQEKFILPRDVEAKVASIRRQGCTIATLNGSFDLLHAGHLQIIYEASLVADVLIVALNTDTSIKAYKNPHRPIIPLEFRLQMVAALEFVNYVTWFDETTPCRILSEIKPDVHVNGAEYGENCIEAPIIKAYGGKIHIVQLVPGLSTSQVLRTITEIQQREK